MREIKFRCWNSHGKVMHDWPELVEKNKIHLLANQKPSYVIMQYTGLKDVNGVEIYEGDIIKVVSNIASDVFLVEIHCGNASYCSKPDCPLGTIYPTMITMTKEVIGNIYENPELLQEAA